jgi:nitroreductase
MELQEAIKERFSTNNFSSKKPDWRDIIEAIDTSRFAPMAGNITTIRWVIIDDKKQIEQIAEASQQNFITNAHYVAVLCSDTKKTVNAYGSRGEKYARQQAGAAIQNFLLSIEEKGLASCWIGHFVDEQIHNTLSIPSDIEIEAVFPIGYSLRPKKKNSKMELDLMLYFHKWKNKKMKSPPVVKRNA